MHNHGEGYRGGEKCRKCERIIGKFKCPVCDGSGKPQNAGWAKIRDTCPACKGNKHRHCCPIGGFLPLSDEFDGITCRSYNDNFVRKQDYPGQPKEGMHNG